jgi:hypothetical protein
MKKKKKSRPPSETKSAKAPTKSAKPPTKSAKAAPTRETKSAKAAPTRETKSAKVTPTRETNSAKRATKSAKASERPVMTAPTTTTRDLATLDAREIDALRQDLERRAATAEPSRWNADAEDIQRSVVRLVLALVEFLRKLLERQAIRRMEQDTLSPQEIEDIGQALMRLEETIRDLAARFGLRPEELNLDLGPLGRLM